MPEDGSEDALTPLHPNYVKSMRIGWLIGMLPFVIGAQVLEVAGTLPHGAFLAPVLLVAVYAIVRAPLRRYHARGYQMGADRLRVVRGLIFRSDTVVPIRPCAASRLNPRCPARILVGLVGYRLEERYT